MPVLLLLLGGMIDFSRAVASYALISNAAREGARAAIFEQTSDATIQAAVNSHLLFVGPLPSASISVIPTNPSERRSNTTVEVSLEYDFNPLFSTLSGLPASVRMTATSRVLIE